MSFIFLCVFTDNNKDKIVDVLVKNCPEKSQLDKLSGTYKKKYRKDMRGEIEPLMEEEVQNALDPLLASKAEFDAKCLNDAIEVNSLQVRLKPFIIIET